MSPGERALADAGEIVKFHINFGTAARVLATHVDDGSGRCAGCTLHNIARPVWPCVHAHYAGVARELEAALVPRDAS